MSWIEGLLGDNLQIYLHKTCGHGMARCKHSETLYGLITVYSKRNAHLIKNFFVPPLGEGGQKFTSSIMLMGVLHMLNFYRYKTCSCFEDILKRVETCFKTKIAVLECTLPEKKRNFNLPIFPGAPSFLTLTQDRVML